jgi:multicomponent Na+:H+ antiporter subunit D
MITGAGLLVLALLIPLLAIPGIIAAYRVPNVREGVTLVAGLLLLAVVTAIYRAYETGVVFELTLWQWLPGLGLAFRIEPLGLLFALIASFLWPVTSLYALGYMRAHHEQHQTRFYVCFAAAMAAVMGLAFAANLVTLFVFYEILTIATYPLVTHTGTDKARKGGRVYLGLLLSTSIVFLLFAIILTWQYTGSVEFTPGGVFTEESSRWLATLLLPLFVFGIGKAALMPFHRWLPAAMVAPTPVSALLHAVAVVKAGVFTVMKVAVYIFGLDLLGSLPSAQFLLYVAGITIVLASLIAMRQDNLKARLAYSTVSQLAYITMGALLANSAGVTGGAMHMATHAVGKITLFFCAGAILIAAHKSEISDMQGLGRQMPVTMIAFFIGSLSIIGLPPTGGTWSKWYLMTGVLDAGQWFLMLALVLSSLLNMSYLLSIPVRAFLPTQGGAVRIERSDINEAPWPCLMALMVTALCCIALFFWPQGLWELVSSIV